MDATPAPSPPSIPDHTLRRVIGRGAYGEVWLAQNIMGAWRAVKVVRRELFANARPYDREFDGIRQFEPVSRRHESQVDVLHVGRNDSAGYFFYVMELADDVARGEEIVPADYAPRTLRHELETRERLTPAETVQIGIALATALAHLHENGLIHRDVKPSNIIFVHGQPKLADLGLVAAQNDALSLVGTSGYIPPEGHGTPQADVFSLGKVLYEAHTGRDRAQFPELPTRLEAEANIDTAHELNLVILKACASDPARRHESAGALREDLLLLQAGHSVQRLWKAERAAARGRRIAWIAVLIAAMCALPYSKMGRDLLARVWFRVNGREMNLKARDSYDLRPAPLPGSRAATRLALYENCDRAEVAPMRLERYAYEWTEPAPPGVCLHLDAHGGGNWWSLDFSADSTLLAVANETGLRIFDARTGERAAVLPMRDLLSAKFLPDGKTLLLQTRDRLALVAWDRPATDARWLRLGDPRDFAPGAPYSGALAADAARCTVALPNANGDWWLFHLDAGGHPRRVLAGTLPSPDGRGFAALSPGGEWLAASASRIAPPAVWSCSDIRLAHPPLHEADGVINSSAVFSSNAHWVAEVSRRAVRVFAAGSWRAVRELRGEQGDLYHDPLAVFSPDSRMLAVSMQPSGLRFFDTTTWRLGVAFSANLEATAATAFSADGRKLALITDVGHVLLFDLPAASAAFARFGGKWAPPGPAPTPVAWKIASVLCPAPPGLGGLAPRDPACAPGELDLGPFYTMSLSDRSAHWNGATELDGSMTRTGRLEFGGVRFDARGIVQLAGGKFSDQPLFVKGIRAGMRGHRIHFLHACGWAAASGEQIGGYTIHYAGGERVEIPLTYEENTLQWLSLRDDACPAPLRAVVAWRGMSEGAAKMNGVNQFYRFTWENPHPEKVIEGIDFFSLQSSSAPFLIGITVEGAL